MLCSGPGDCGNGDDKTDELRDLPLGLAHRVARQPGAAGAPQAPPDGRRRRLAPARSLLSHRVRLRPPHLPLGLPQPEGPQAAQRHLHVALARRHHDVSLLYHVAVLSADAIDAICRLDSVTRYNRRTQAATTFLTVTVKHCRVKELGRWSEAK